MAAAIGSLKGPRHGGANIKVMQMFEDMKKEVKDWTDEEEVSRYLERLLSKDAFDHAGLIYGVGHAVYSKSDPRAIILKSFVEKLSEEKGLHKEFELYNLVEKLAPYVISGERQMYKGVSVNAVSYTHLDVYKRQEIRIPVILKDFILIPVAARKLICACLLYTSRCV